jgi:hypothetical protein
MPQRTRLGGEQPAHGRTVDRRTRTRFQFGCAAADDGPILGVPLSILAALRCAALRSARGTTDASRSAPTAGGRALGGYGLTRRLIGSASTPVACTVEYQSLRFWPAASRAGGPPRAVAWWRRGRSEWWGLREVASARVPPHRGVDHVGDGNKAGGCVPGAGHSSVTVTAGVNAHLLGGEERYQAQAMTSALRV